MGAPMLSWQRLRDERGAETIWTRLDSAAPGACLRLDASDEGEWVVQLTAPGRWAYTLARGCVGSLPAIRLATAQAQALAAARAFVTALGYGLCGDLHTPERLGGFSALILRDALMLGGQDELAGHLSEPLERGAFLDAVTAVAVAASNVLDDDKLLESTHGQLLDSIGRPFIAQVAASIVGEVHSYKSLEHNVPMQSEADPPDTEWQAAVYAAIVKEEAEAKSP